MTDGARRVEARLRQLFDERYPGGGKLMEAVRYASLEGGKRIRPALTYATAHALGLAPEAVDDAACAVELIHCYSLTHDDLPAMDDDARRRGKPACHKAFGEAVAILAGDALQTMAFETIAAADALKPARKVRALNILASCAGVNGMAGGQALDLALTGARAEVAAVERVHRMKTGALMRAAIDIAAACAPYPSAPVARALHVFAIDIGLCFQIRDDLLDHDAAQAAPSYPAAAGEDGARAALARNARGCLAALEPLGAAGERLRVITRYIARPRAARAP